MRMSRVGRLPFIYSRRNTKSQYTEHHAAEKSKKAEIQNRRRTRPPPWGGSRTSSSGVAAQARGTTTVDALDSRAARYRNRSEPDKSDMNPSSKAAPPEVPVVTHDKIIPAEAAAAGTEPSQREAQVAILCAKQQEYWDNMAERSNVNIFSNGSNLRLRYSTVGKIVLDPSLVGKTETKLALARIQQVF